MGCESNLDEQLLLNIGFREKVKIKGIMIKGAAGHEDQSPSDIKVFVNAGTMSFGDVESQKPAQVLELAPEAPPHLPPSWPHACGWASRAAPVIDGRMSRAANASIPILCASRTSRTYRSLWSATMV